MDCDEEGWHRDNVERGHSGNADSVAQSYSTDDEDERRVEEREYHERAATYLASVGFPTHINSPFQAYRDPTIPNFPVRSPPPLDVKVSVTNSSNTQPVSSAASKKAGSLFSLSSLYDVNGSKSFYGASYLKTVEVVLRCATAVFSLVAFCVMSSTREMRVAAGSSFEVKFSDYQAYNFLVALNVLTFTYSSAQVAVVLQSSSSSSKSSVFATPLRLAICKYFCDQILAFCLFSASSSAATASEMSHYGLHNIWPPACSTWKLWMFCLKADIAVVISFFSSLSILLSSIISGFSLLRIIASV